MIVPTGKIYLALAERQISFLLYSEAIARLHARQTKSAWGHISDVLGYVAAGVGIGASTGILNNTKAATRNKILIGAALAEGLFAIVIPATRAQVPAPLEWETLILRDADALRIAPTECATGIVLGGQGNSFTFKP